MRIMFDTNAFDKMHSSETDVARIIESNKYEYYVTSVQIEEIGDIPDEKKEQRIKNLLALCMLRAHLLYTPAVFGYSRFGYCIIADENDIYEDLLTDSRNNVKDAMIGSTAYRENCTIVTDDKDFTKKLKAHSISTMTYDEFMHSLK